MKITDFYLVTEGASIYRTNNLWRLSIVLSVASVLVYIIGFSTDYWGQLDHEDYSPMPGATIDAHFGLWRKCVTIVFNGSVVSDDCQDLDNDQSYKPAAKTLCSVGLILAVLALPIAILAGCGQNSATMGCAGVVTLIAATIAVTGSAVFIGKAKDDDFRLEIEYSAILALVGSVVMVIGGMCQLLSIRTGYVTLG